jgi:hypothetical protein
MCWIVAIDRYDPTPVGVAEGCDKAGTAFRISIAATASLSISVFGSLIKHNLSH